MADIHRRYFEERYFADLLPVREGPFCAIDIDGVLETRWLAFPAIAPAGAAALRSLAVHGYRAVLVTGRSLEEVRARCRSYRLTGGVAEYGAVTYDALRGSARSRLSEHDWAALEALRNALTQMDGVYLDPIYRHTVRAFRLGSAGERRGLKMETIAAALERAGVEECVRAVRGGLQTDFVAKSVDKGRGLRALMEEFGNGDLSSPVALAVGDTASDLPMFAVARRAIAPANAAPELRGHVEIGRRPFGAGLLDAVNAEVHAGTRCRRCEARPGASHSAALLQASLRALDGGKFGKLQQAAVLAVTLLSGV
jgi:hydroxymethylpyrimidine pyrophosphatase-like HAD family hydrolase